jgi:excisionase family DNA binding protein
VKTNEARSHQEQTMTHQNPPTDHNEGQHDLLTITEAADLLGAPVATLRYWRHLGTGPASFRLGRRILYRRADVSAWVEDQRGAWAEHR